jgi:hypothetical protein
MKTVAGGVKGQGIVVADGVEEGVADVPVSPHCVLACLGGSRDTMVLGEPCEETKRSAFLSFLEFS